MILPSSYRGINPGVASKSNGAHMSQPIDCATKQTKKWLTDGAHRGGTEDKRIDLPRLEGREGQGLLSCLQWKGRERTED